ncbi:MAG: type II secretion system F family protein [bacterium]
MTRKQQKDSLLAREVSFGKVNLEQKAAFAKHLSIMLKSGISLSETLSIAEESSTGKLKSIIREIRGSAESGSSLAEAFARYPNVFSGFFVKSIYIGEASGTLTSNLENVAEQIEKEKALMEKIKGAMLYPTVVLAATFILGMILSFVVLPQITPLFEGLKVNLPVTTRALIWFSHFIQQNGIFLFLGIIFTVIFINWLVRQKFIRPLTHRIILNFPVFKKISRNTNLARFTRTLGMLLKSGVNIDEALEISKEMTGNYYYARALEKISQAVRKGSKLSENLQQEKNLFPTMLTSMIRVGEESGNFEETLFYLADFYETKVDSATKSLAAAIEPILLIFIGLVVAFLALSIITPIYDLTGNLKR